MIKFKNINGDVFLAVGSIKRKSALNGEKSLSGTLFEGDDVLNKIDKGWSLEFDNEPYVVTYFERNDNDNTVEFDAIHKFFWDMNKDVLYFSWSGSHTAKAYLEQLFKDTGYQYALNFEPSAFEKENWGMKNKLSLFNDVIDSMGGEFEINGTLVSIFKNVGSDLSTIVRHGFNLSDMSLENDNTDFVTYGEGFGAYADQQSQTGERLHVTYTSPLAKTFGKLHAEPIDDQRYTIKDNLLQAIKNKVDGSFAISIKLSLYDLTAAGYPYKMANVGDWLLAIDENLDFKQKIRIISVDDEFATDGIRISYTVTCGDIGVVQKYQQANASLGQKVDSAYQNAQDAKEYSIQAVIAANGKNTTRWFDSKEEMDAFKANEGDMAFLRTGDGEAMYIYTKMPDGSFKWVKRVDPDTGEQIVAGVDDAIKQAKSQAAQMDEVRASEAAVFQSEANAALSSAAAERAVFSSNAASMATGAVTHADSMANSAAAYGKAQAASVLIQAQSELATAKQELGSEVSKAQSDIVATNKELAGKVSQSDFNTKTDDLTTKYGQVKATADAVTTEVTNYKIANDKKVSANAASINTLNNQITSKVSQTDYDKETKDLEGKYTETKQTVNSMSNVVTELQAKANTQGQINQLFNTEFTPDLQSWTANNSNITNAVLNKNSIIKGSNVLNITHGSNTGWCQYYQVVNNFVAGGIMSASVYARMKTGNWSFTIDSYNSDGIRTNIKSVSVTTNTKLLKIENITIPTDAIELRYSFWGQNAGILVVSQPMLVFADHVGDYAPGNYNNNARVTALELDVNGIHGTVNDPNKGLSATWDLASNGQTTAITAVNNAKKAQDTADAANTTANNANDTANANTTKINTAIQTADGTQNTVKVMQDDFTILQNKQTVTAGQVTTEIEDRKNGDKNVLVQTSGMISDQISDYNRGVITTIAAMADGIYANVSSTGIRYIRFNGQGNDQNDGTHFQRLMLTNNAGTDVLAGLKATAPYGGTLNDPSYGTDGSFLDDDTYIFLSTKPNGNTYIQYDLGKVMTDLSTVTIKMNPGKEVYYSVCVQVSTDGQYWRTVFLGNVNCTDNPFYDETARVGVIGTQGIIELTDSSFGMMVTKHSDKIISGINGDTSGVTITGKQLTLDGDTTVTGDFYAKGGNFKNLNASNIIAGTLNAANIQVINMDASNIATGVLDSTKIKLVGKDSTIDMSGDGVEIISNDSTPRSVTIDDGSINFSRTSNGKHEYLGALESFYSYYNTNTNGIGVFIKSKKYLGDPYGGDEFRLGYYNSLTGDNKTTTDMVYDASGQSHQGGFNFYNKAVIVHDGLDVYSETRLYDRVVLGRSGDNPPIINMGGEARMYGTGGIILGTYDYSTKTPGTKMLIDRNNVNVWDNFNVYNGSKNAAQITRDGVRLTPAYETAENYVGDIGESSTSVDCKVKIVIEDILTDLMNTDIAYQVFLSPYYNANVWVLERGTDYFVIESDKPNATFAWEIKGKRRGFESERLVRTDDTFEEVKQMAESKGLMERKI